MAKQDERQTKSPGWRQDLRTVIERYYRQYLRWLAFNEEESQLVNYLRLVYKIPVSIIVAIVSPILAIVLFVIFFSAI